MLGRVIDRRTGETAREDEDKRATRSNTGVGKK